MKSILIWKLVLITLVLFGSLLNLQISQVMGEILIPFTPHEHSTLIITTSATYSGYRNLYAEFARFGFNITILETGTAVNSTGAIDFLKHPLTSNLAQYDIVILEGSSSTAFAPLRMNPTEIEHFTKGYDGILITMGESMMINETDGNRWSFSGYPVSSIEDRLGIDLTGISDSHVVSGRGGYTWNGTVTKVSQLVEGLPNSINFTVYPTWSIAHYKGALKEASLLYKFTTDEPEDLLGITYFRNSTGAVGIFINLPWVLGIDIGSYEFRWLGLENKKDDLDYTMPTRSDFLGRLMAYALGEDYNTIIKPQPLMAIRLDDVGASGIIQGWSLKNFDENALSCLKNFDAALKEFNIPYATIAAIYYNWQFTNETWQKTRAFMLSKQGDWEFANHYDHAGSTKDFYNWTAEQHKTEIQRTTSNMISLGFQKPSLVLNPRGDWGPGQWRAFADLGFYVVTPSDRYFSDIFGTWTKTYNPLRTWVKDGVLVHPSENVHAARLIENFTQMNKNTIWFTYAGGSYDYHQSYLINSIDDVAVYVDHYENFRMNEVGTWALKTVLSNITYEMPDIRFVKFGDGINYFAKRNATIYDAERVGNVIDFNVNADNVLPVNKIGKGMLWYTIKAGLKIQSVEVDGAQWHFFDDYSLTFPATNSHIKITLGEKPLVPEFPFGQVLEISLVMVMVLLWSRKLVKRTSSTEIL